jgi:hypothetical protein
MINKFDEQLKEPYNSPRTGSAKSISGNEGKAT